MGLNFYKPGWGECIGRNTQDTSRKILWGRGGGLGKGGTNLSYLIGRTARLEVNWYGAKLL